jgi:hypothetical protein
LFYLDKIMPLEVLDFLMGYLSRLFVCTYLNLKVVDVFIYRFFTGFTADIPKVTAHERIQHLYH